MSWQRKSKTFVYPWSKSVPMVWKKKMRRWRKALFGLFMQYQNIDYVASSFLFLLLFFAKGKGVKAVWSFPQPAVWRRRRGLDASIACNWRAARCLVFFLMLQLIPCLKTSNKTTAASNFISESITQHGAWDGGRTLCVWRPCQGHRVGWGGGGGWGSKYPERDVNCEIYSCENTRVVREKSGVLVLHGRHESPSSYCYGYACDAGDKNELMGQQRYETWDDGGQQRNCWTHRQATMSRGQRANWAMVIQYFDTCWLFADISGFIFESAGLRLYCHSH